MVFVDSAFMQKYRHLGSRGVDQYVATVVGIMADLYQHPSIGKPLKEWWLYSAIIQKRDCIYVCIETTLWKHISPIIFLKLKLLDIIKMNSDRFDISTEASKTLRHFCEYQRNFGQYVKKRKGSKFTKTCLKCDEKCDFNLAKTRSVNFTYRSWYLCRPKPLWRFMSDFGLRSHWWNVWF